LQAKDGLTCAKCIRQGRISSTDGANRQDFKGNSTFGSLALLLRYTGVKQLRRRGEQKMKNGNSHIKGN
jgi:hypothetical protein